MKVIKKYLPISLMSLSIISMVLLIKYQDQIDPLMFDIFTIVTAVIWSVSMMISVRRLLRWAFTPVKIVNPITVTCNTEYLKEGMRINISGYSENDGDFTITKIIDSNTIEVCK